jgi:transposase
MPAEEESPMPRRLFTLEFKTSAARLVREQGYSVAQAAQSLGVDPRSIRDWLAKFAPPPQAGAAPAAADAELRQEVERLRAENKRLLMEREILKKATAFFAREQP